ncbi:MAG: DegT/DnrJ/EryC1/StrS family aminotransferase [Elusimicrobia bacterium]|nr:DegT/DnrJ/EryC1/StrS family aminotransferase [Elusimicrobiota bacterium]
MPLFDLQRTYLPLRKEIVAAATRVLDSGAFILGPDVSAFEAEFARAIGATHCTGVCSGTQALQVALEAVGVGRGDEVIVPAHTFVATATAVSAAGATPVFVDVDPTTLTLDPVKAAEKITPRTKALLPVHIYGYPADMDAVMALARKRGLKVVEDCAQAHLTRYKGRVVGGIGDMGCFSFYPSKNLGAAGDAGAVATNDQSFHDAAKAISNCGRSDPDDRYRHDRMGQNFRLDTLQAAILRVKLKRLAAWTEERRRGAARYRKGLAGLPITLPPDGENGTQHSYHLFVIRSERRDALAKHLSAANIDNGVYYPIPLHLQPLYADLGHKTGDFPATEQAVRDVLALPLYPGLKDAEIDRVCEEIRRFHR